jgi:hypothetical protein
VILISENKNISRNSIVKQHILEVSGNRTLVFVLDLSSSDMITEVAEPIPQGFEANVEIHPAMIEIKLSNID